MLTKNKTTIKTWQVYLFGIIIIATIGLKLFYFYYWPKVVVRIKNQTFHVLVADNPKRWEKGLGGRENLGGLDGMLFVFADKKQHAFVMRNMKFPLDIIWFKEGKIVDIAPNVQVEPGKLEHQLTLYPARDVSDRVLEIPAGLAQKYNFKIGDELEVVK